METKNRRWDAPVFFFFLALFLGLTSFYAPFAETAFGAATKEEKQKLDAAAEAKKKLQEEKKRTQNMISELNTLKNDMNTLLDVYVSVLQERIAEAQITADMASSKMSRVLQQQLYIESLERVSKIKEDLYLHLLSRREELMISQPSIEPNGKVLDPARINRTPVAPNESRTTLMGLLIGLLIPVAVFFLRRLFDTKVKYHNDVIYATATPFLCEIPSREKDDDRSIVVTESGHDAMCESFRLLRAKADGGSGFPKE